MIIDKQFLKSLDPCTDRWENYLEHYSDWSGTRLEFLELEKISDRDKLWVMLRPETLSEKQLHLLACDFAESVLHFFENEYPNDNRPRQAIEAKRRWVNGEISDSELQTAWAAAWDARAARAAWAAWDARDASAAARAASATAKAARVASAASDTAWTARAAMAAELKKQVEKVKTAVRDINNIPNKE